MKAWTCYLLESSPRYQAWRDILGTDEVLINNPIPSMAEYVSEGQVECHALALKLFTTDQLERLIMWAAQAHGCSPNEIAAALATTGFPIRAEDVSVAFDLRYFV